MFSKIANQLYAFFFPAKEQPLPESPQSFRNQDQPRLGINHSLIDRAAGALIPTIIKVWWLPDRDIHLQQMVQKIPANCLHNLGLAFFLAAYGNISNKAECKVFGDGTHRAPYLYVNVLHRSPHDNLSKATVFLPYLTKEQQDEFNSFDKTISELDLVNNGCDKYQAFHLWKLGL